MTLAVCAMSHSPLLDLGARDSAAVRSAHDAIAHAASFVADFDPELVVIFAPDHYNGFHYRLMPTFSLAFAATGVGDYGTYDGPLSIPQDIAHDCATYVLAAGIDLAHSMDTSVDHGTTQPLSKLLGTPTRVPVLPFFINCIAAPLGRFARVRALGEAVGRFLAQRPERILIIGSGGLSHDPPMPTLQTATQQVLERIVAGTAPSAYQRQARTVQVIAAADEFADGGGPMRALNPSWDTAFLDLLEAGRIPEVDAWTNDWVVEQGGGSAHEVRTWIAAYAALAAAGDYRMAYRYYEPTPELIAGFAVTTAVSNSA